VRIDGPYGPGIGGLPPEQAPAPKGGRPGAPADLSGAQAELYGPQKEYIRSATAAQDVNKQAVAEARELLKSGKLDTADAARRAAEAMLGLGI
jgi:hypothetical protein